MAVGSVKKARPEPFHSMQTALILPAASNDENLKFPGIFAKKLS
jgi:hypothetical protein